MVQAAKVLALVAADLYSDPELIKAAKAELEKRRSGLTYRSRIPADQGPPLNYRSME